jgi:hypothetical protein
MLPLLLPNLHAFVCWLTALFASSAHDGMLYSLLLPTTWCVAAVNLLNPATAAKLAGMQQQQQKAQAQQRPKQSHQQLDEIVASSPLLKALNVSGLNPVVARCMAKLGFSEATPIQSACWGLSCAGRDVLGHAEPGKLLIWIY